MYEIKEVIKLLVIFEAVRYFCFILISVFTESLLVIFQQPRKANKVFYGQTVTGVCIIKNFVCIISKALT